MKKEKNKTSFEHIANLWDAKIGDTLARNPLSSKSGSMKVTVDAVVAMLGDLKGKCVYEVACGNGFLSRYLVEGGAKKVYASDISKNLIHLAQTRYSTKNISYSVRSATDFKGIPKNFFDAIVIHQGIFYIDDLDRLLRGVHGVLKKGGVLIFTLIHPLYYITQADIGEINNLEEVLGKYNHYLKDRLVKVEKKWDLHGGGEDVVYWQYKRPLSTYINICAKNGLYVSEICEPATRIRKKGKTYRSSIPSSLIVKAVKV